MGLPSWICIFGFTCLFDGILAVADEAPAEKKPEKTEAEKAASDAGTRKVPLLNWGEKDRVQVYYAEFLLSRWVLDHAPWNAYHSGLAFVNNATGEKVLFDYCPEDVSSVMKMLVPAIDSESMWKALILGDVKVRWQNKASVKFFTHWPKSYENLVRIGSTKGGIVNSFSEWVKDDFAPTHNTFDPLEVLISNGTYIRSTMCHDFVTDSLWVLHRKGVRLRPEGPIFRDHIIMYTEAVERVYEDQKTGRHRRELLRYLRLLRFFYRKIADQFTHGREALLINWKLGLPTYLRNKGVDLRVQITPPFLNYCYLPMAIPPAKHNLQDTNKLCALAMMANLTNTTITNLRETPTSRGFPFNAAAALSPEGRLDRNEVLGSLALIVLFAALLSRPSASSTLEAPGPVEKEE